MSTMIYNNVEYTKVFIDPTLAEDAGDGSTPALALKDFPVLADNTAYIVRRSNSAFASIPATNMYVTNIMFIGMPRSTDALYPYMDTAEKTAWTENYDYAMVRVNCNNSETPSVILTNLVDMTMFGCYFFRDSDTVNTRDSRETMFFINSNNRANVTVNKCKVGFLGDDMDSDTWLSENTGFNSKNAGTKFISCDVIKLLSVENCVFNERRVYAYSYQFNSHWCRSALFNTYGGNTVSFKNNIFNIAPYDDTAAHNSEASNNSTLYNEHTTNLIMSNNIFNTIDYGNIQYARSNFVYLLDSGNFSNQLRFTDNKVYYKQMKNNTPRTDIFGNVRMFIFDCCANYFIRDFELDFTNSAYKGGCNVIDLIPLYSRCTQNEFSHIKVHYNNEGTIETTDTTSSVRYTMNNKINVTDINNYTPIPQYGICKANNIDIQRFDGGAILSLTGTCMEADTVRGAVYLYFGSYLKVDNLYNNHGGRRIVQMDNANALLQVNNLVVNKNNPLYPYDASIPQIEFSSDVNYKYTNNIFINHTNALPFDMTLYNTAPHNYGNIAWISNDYNGLFYERNSSASAKSWGVTRTGTKAKASLKLETAVESQYNDLIIGQNPCTGFLIKPASTGNKTITAYIACSNSYTEFTGMISKVWLEAFVRQDSNTSETKRYDSLTLGSVQPDTSTWNGDTGVSAFKIQLPVEVKTLDDIEVKVHFKWFDAIGYTYLDPELTIA